MNGLLLDARGAASPPQIDCGETWFHAMDAPCTLFHVQPRQELGGTSYKQELSQSARFGSAPEWAVVGLNIRSGRLLHLSERLTTYHLVQQYPSSPSVGIQV